MRPKLAPESPIWEGPLTDQVVGRFVRLDIMTWRDLSGRSLNDIADLAYFRLWELQEIKKAFEEAGLAMLPFDAFALLSSSTRKHLSAAKLSSIWDLASLSRSELGGIPRIGGQSVDECEEVLALAEFILRPAKPSDERLHIIEKHLADELSVEETASALNVSIWKASQLRRQAPRARAGFEQAEREYSKWEQQAKRAQA
jgi:hypothetical protein